jgi:hypothetical protein
MGKTLRNSPEERLVKCRLMAAEAYQQAQAAHTTEARQGFLKRAHAWETMMNELARAGVDPDATLPLKNSLGRAGTDQKLA